jgi:hypothetical protein
VIRCEDGDGFDDTCTRTYPILARDSVNRLEPEDLALSFDEHDGTEGSPENLSCLEYANSI